MSSPSPEQLEYAGLLARKAGNDLSAGRTLIEAGASDDVIGFHLQQAVEKALKATLVLTGVDFPRTHDLDFLLELVRDGGLEPPQSLEATAWLSPWAAELRYDEPSRSLDRDGALATAERAVQWADETLRRAETS